MAIGFLGTRLDIGFKPDRWERWRPTVAICQHPELPLRRLEILHDPREENLLKRVVQDIQEVSPLTEIVPRPLALSDPWDFEGVFSSLYAFARAYPFDLESEDYLIHITTGTHVAQICLFLLTESRHLPGRLIQTSPPKRGSDELARGSFRLIDLDLSRYDQIASRFQEEEREGASFLKVGIPTRNAAFNQMMEQLTRVAQASRAPILLTGPTGAGKSQLARRLYQLKKNRRLIQGGFVEVNCATLRGDAAMSAIFGHVKGAFTGAERERQGLMRAAHQGMLFLDEIGELGLDEQAMLLKAIETGRFMPVGSDKEVESEFQLIAGTNRSLSERVREGRFREDLLARIDLWTFRLPGLAERREDIEPNLEYELDRFAERQGSRVSFSREARARFLSFATSSEALWSGNFRDLNAAVTRMATLSAGGRITEGIVREEEARLKARWQGPAPATDDDALLREVLGERVEQIDLFDRAQLAAVIRACREAESASEASRRLFAVSRTQRTTQNDADRLRKYLAKWDLSFAAVSLPSAERR